MTRDEAIAANDELRRTFKGGTVLMTPAVYDLDASLRGRALYRMSRCNTFSPDSMHDAGMFIFAGYTFIWHIATFANERTITLSLYEDWLGVPLPWSTPSTV